MATLSPLRLPTTLSSPLPGGHPQPPFLPGIGSPPAGRGKALRWSCDSPPSGKSGSGDSRPSFKEVLLASIAASQAPSTMPERPSPVSSRPVRAAPRLVIRLRDSLPPRRPSGPGADG